jgi:hypothetical protein
MSPTQADQDAKLRKLCEVEGYETVEALLTAAMMDAVSPAICMSPDCSYTCEMEPDQQRGWCDECRTNTMMAAPVLAGMV